MRVSDLSVCLLSYFVGADHLYALLIDQNGHMQRFPLTSCEQAFPRIENLLNVLEQPYRWTASQLTAVMHDFSKDWGRDLLPPADKLRPFDVLLIVPHHFLHGVPLHLVECDDGEVLATSYGVAYCSSGTLLARCVERNRARQFDAHEWTFPLSDDGAPSVGPHVATCLSYGVDVLTDKDTAYRDLANAFASHFPDRTSASRRSDIKIAMNRDHIGAATASSVRPDVICLVCHGYKDLATIRKSGLLLASPRGLIDMLNVRVHGDVTLQIMDLPFAEIPLQLEPVAPHSVPNYIFDPEILTIGELGVHCETNAQLVALFGCSTGTGSVASADDYVSLAYQWLKTGATSVVANLWEADFAIISDWAERFAVNWARLRQPKVIAAREATRRLLADRPALVEQPALWGSLAVIGDWL